MPVLFRATPWQDLTNGRFVHKPTTVVARHARDTPVRPSTLRTTDAPRTHPPSGQSVLARHAAALRRHGAVIVGWRSWAVPVASCGMPIDREALVAFTQELVRIPSVHDP